MPGYDGMLDIADRSTTAESRHADPWTSDERHAYVKSLGIAAGPNEGKVLLLLEDAISDAPLPPPWVMCRDDAGQAFWWDQVNHESVWKHPLEPTLREMAGVCQACLSLDQKGREPCLEGLKTSWEQEAKGSLGKWCRTHEEGREYFFHGDSKEVTWTHPGERILPGFYMKMKVLERLREELEVDSDEEAPNLEATLTPAATAAPTVPAPPAEPATPATPAAPVIAEITLPRPGTSERSKPPALDSARGVIKETAAVAIRKEEVLPDGLAATMIAGERSGSGPGGWWWGCSPIKYMDDEASNRAYLKGASAGRSLCNELTVTGNTLKGLQGSA